MTAEQESDGVIRAPALCDLQVNGGWGTSFASPNLTVEQVVFLAEQYAGQGVARFCPTLITASLDVLTHALRVIANACKTNLFVADAILGVHLEGPWISDRDGYRGAHASQQIRDPNIVEFDQLQQASGDRIKLVTLAPERPGGIEFIRQLVQRGVVVAIGHTAADGPTIAAAVDAGASLSTHLGNGIATPLPRHPNPIWHQAADDRLFASLIADLEHVDPATLNVLTRAKGHERTIFVSDLSPLAGCSAGVYGEWEVTADRRVVVAGTPYLAGACRPLFDALAIAVNQLGWSLDHALHSMTINPLSVLGRAVDSAPERLRRHKDDALHIGITQSSHCIEYELLLAQIGGRTWRRS